MFIGIDVGGSKLAGARLENGVLSAHHAEPTQTEHGTEVLLDQFVSLIEMLRTPSTSAVGIGVPSTVEFATGRVRSSVNIPLEDLPLRQILSERTGMPVFVDNDGACAAFAEAHHDGQMVTRNLVMLTIGTGVGGGIVINGRLYRGATGAAAELGHQIIAMELSEGISAHFDGEFPVSSSLEALASGPALGRLAVAAALEHPGSALGVTLAEDGSVGGRDVVRLAMAGDHIAVDALKILGERLGVGIANAINTFDPDEVVIGGGVADAGDLLLGPATHSARTYTLSGVGTATKIRLARHGNGAGILGAALIAEQEFSS